MIFLLFFSLGEIQVPDSCCISPGRFCGVRDHPSNVRYTGCVHRIERIAADNLVVAGAVAVGICLVQVRADNDSTQSFLQSVERLTLIIFADFSTLSKFETINGNVFSRSSVSSWRASSTPSSSPSSTTTDDQRKERRKMKTPKSQMNLKLKRIFNLENFRSWCFYEKPVQTQNINWDLCNKSTRCTLCTVE